MGWLFGHRKVPKVPFPEGKPVEERSLRLPGKLSSQRVFEPEQIKEAAGLGPAVAYPEEEESSGYPAPEALLVSGRSGPSKLPPLAVHTEPSPLFVKMEVYQHLLAEMEEAQAKLSELAHIGKSVEKSEYNEEHHFVKLRRAIRGVHDRLLVADKIIFKA